MLIAIRIIIIVCISVMTISMWNYNMVDEKEPTIVNDLLHMKMAMLMEKDY
ncbi:hypothetical protein IR152_18130 [Clostridioides sp. ES-S-0108-01]|uniref:hypothetical protein n=1 Tax=Clostridioides sp. ES-S-0108-01 TaxID=2770773 RepID=UPI001D0C9D9A|nr:hypothetical protein [Clostridioides sp. ES-S-0108-01]